MRTFCYFILLLTASTLSAKWIGLSISMISIVGTFVCCSRMPSSTCATKLAKSYYCMGEVVSWYLIRLCEEASRVTWTSITESSSYSDSFNFLLISS